MNDLIIIGAGPAGLTAALYAGRARLNTIVLEKMTVGGRILMTETIENYPGFSGKSPTTDLIKQMEEQVKSLGAQLVFDEVKEIDCLHKGVKAQSRSYSARAIIIASGAAMRKLNVPGEDKFVGKGVSYCATCDGPFYKGKEIAVVGGGNAVAEEALYLARFADSVTIIHRRNELRASAILQEELKKNNKIKFLLGNVVTEICGQTKVDSIKLRDLDSGEHVLTVAGVFIYIGYNPDTAFLKGQVNLDEAGFVVTDENMLTSREGIFACGDCRKKGLYQVITACADGAIAADSAYKYLSKGLA